MVKKINAEFHFSDKAIQITLIVYINYVNKTYDIVQPGEEGIFPRKSNRLTEVNKAYMQLALEALEFIDKELYEKK